jgi:hypothetical protein
MRVKQNEGARGSLKWLQRLIARHSIILDEGLRDAGLLDRTEAVEWHSPRKTDDWAEYRDADFLDVVGKAALKGLLEKFWPEQGPQWDALGSVGDKVFLVEAKAHVSELKSSCSAKSKRSRDLIVQSVTETKDAMGIPHENDWLTGYYQYANRLAHLHFLRQHGVDAYLIFVYFVGETGMPGAPIDRARWESGVNDAHKHLGIVKDREVPGVVNLYVDVAALTGKDA